MALGKGESDELLRLAHSVDDFQWDLSAVDVDRRSDTWFRRMW